MSHNHSLLEIQRLQMLCDKQADHIKELKECLEDLITWQNGPPLETYREGWTTAMEKADNLLQGGG